MIAQALIGLVSEASRYGRSGSPRWAEPAVRRTYGALDALQHLGIASAEAAQPGDLALVTTAPEAQDLCARGVELAERVRIEE
jgi:hypothetical protein